MAHYKEVNAALNEFCGNPAREYAHDNPSLGF